MSKNNKREKFVNIETLDIKTLNINEEFDLNIGETASIKDLRLTVVQNLVPPIVKLPWTKDVKAGIRINVEEKGMITELNFYDGEEKIKQQSSYIIELIRRIPGTGTFKVMTR